MNHDSPGTASDSNSNVSIPEPILLPVTLSWELNQPEQMPYVPSQLLAPFPERLLPTVRERTSGISRLAEDQQKPLDDGVELRPGSQLAFELSYRRAGAWCFRVPFVRLRMERLQLAGLSFGLREGENFWPLEQFADCTCIVQPGRVIYQLKDDNARLGVKMVVLMPLSPPAYGCMARVEVQNLATEARPVELVAIVNGLPSETRSGTPPQWPPAQGALLPRVEVSPGVLSLPAQREGGFLHDANYSILVGFEGESFAGYNADDKTGLCATRLQLTGSGTVTSHVTAVIDSPGWDEAAALERIEGYFARNPNLPEPVRKSLVEDTLDTFARLVVNGETAFATLRANADKGFDNSLKQWDNGAYRETPVRFEMPDKKLQTLANLTANALFPGLVQPPGLVHDAQHGDGWGYIFCYRHVHAASDIALEPQALGYLRLLSANQGGPIRGIFPDFSGGHPTLFDASYIDSVWHYYKWSGDLEAVRQLWPTLQRAVVHIDRSLDGDGDGLYKDTLHQWKSDFDNRGPSSSFQTAIVWRALTDMVEFARLMGDEQGVTEYQTKADKTYRAVQTQLWSDEFAMLGPKCPLDILRLHPQSLEIEMPIWTGLVDEFQAQSLLDWSTANLEFYDEAGGRWMYHNDWWPAVWSQHCPAEGDAMMVGWAHMLGGRHDIGNDILRTIAAASIRSDNPGFNYLFSSSGTGGGGDPATAQGAFVRALVEGTFGVRPAVDQKQIILRPHFPSDWDQARFTRPGLDFTWHKRGDEQIAQVKTNPDIRAVVELSVNTPVDQVTLDGKPVPFEIEPTMYWGLVRVVTPPGGGRVTIRTTGEPAEFSVPEQAQVGETTKLDVRAVDTCKVLDRFGMIEVISATPTNITFRPLRQGTGRCLFFLECTRGNLRWIQPIALQIGPRRALDAVARTVDNPLPPDASFVPVDLCTAYIDDIQGRRPGYWTMPVWKPDRDFPTKVRVGEVPFLLGPMGPSEDVNKNLIIIANTIGNTWQWDAHDPTPSNEGKRTFATGASIQVGRRLHKFYLLSLNMNLPQKCYVPAVEVMVRYEDGRQQTSVLVPPLNFDCYYQDFGINTKVLPLPFSSEERDAHPKYFGYDLGQFHLTMTDVICEPSRLVESIELRAISTETYFGLAGLTLAEARGD